MVTMTNIHTPTHRLKRSSQANIFTYKPLYPSLMKQFVPYIIGFVLMTILFSISYNMSKQSKEITDAYKRYYQCVETEAMNLDTTNQVYVAIFNCEHELFTTFNK